ncbi:MULTISPECIES: hypothetical protein [unclassified Paenibacillus]
MMGHRYGPDHSHARKAAAAYGMELETELALHSEQKQLKQRLQTEG